MYAKVRLAGKVQEQIQSPIGIWASSKDADCYFYAARPKRAWTRNASLFAAPFSCKTVGWQRFGISKILRHVKTKMTHRQQWRKEIKMAEGTKVMDQALQVMTDREGKYLTFCLAGEEYGIEILKVKEIIGIMPITVVPQTPSYIKGVINLRGKVIPVIDLRLRFSLSTAEFTERTCIIVVEIAAKQGTIIMGFVVDSVSEVLNIKGTDIEPTPSFGTRLNTAFILGMAKAGDGIKILLDIDKILSAEELEAASGIL